MRKAILAIILIALTLGVSSVIASRTPAAAMTSTFAPQGLPTLSISNATLAEGNAGTTNMIFAVTLSASGLHDQIRVRYATADGSATSPSDYTATSGTLTFPPGGDTPPMTISVQIVGDTVIEPDETLSVNLFEPLGATISDGLGIGTITNDDGTGCTFSITPFNQTFEAAGGTGSVTVTASSGCNWTANSNTSFITVTSVEIRPGGGTVNYSVSPNESSNFR